MERSYSQLKQDADADTVKLLADVPLFQRLPQKVLPELLRDCDMVEYDAGDEIIKQGLVNFNMYVLRTGSCIVEVDHQVAQTLTRGDYFGEASLFRSLPNACSVSASSFTIAIKINRDAFERLGLHKHLADNRYEKVNKRFQMMAGTTASGKTKAALMAARSESLLRDTGSQTSDANTKQPVPCWRSNWQAIKNMFSNWLSASAFVLVPIAQYCIYAEMPCGAIFLSNFLAIIPLAHILGDATEAIADHTGQLIGGLLNATFGNAVEMIMCVQAVKAGLISVVQGNLLGSILSNLLLVLGMAIIASGLRRHSQGFNAQGAAASMSCQLVACISICLPTIFGQVSQSAGQEVLAISRISAVLLMSMYGFFLFFMLKSHADLFADSEEAEEDQDEESRMSPPVSVLFLLLSTLVVFLCSEGLVHSIKEVSQEYGLSEAFIGVILLPIVGNAAEHATAVTCAYKGMMDLALGVAVGSSTQIALFVVPCAVLFGWIYDQPMSLGFTIFGMMCQLLSVFLVERVLSSGQTTWLHGAMLCTVYVFIAVECLFMENDE
eukprot:TRINITY_DN27251_c0_g1_i1.p1 TRINITY_DN27251_c0_g1~~TRINITY_DN27251_c0_g1_i1.p1  ORF type:complete len:551 (-),score=104.20 TRINITY_DN27251_c0_g1_i1:134-1786(-)